MFDFRLFVKPMEHQMEAARFIVSRKASLICFKTGTGKSILAIVSAFKLLKDKSVEKVLMVVTASSVIEVTNDFVTKSNYTPVNLKTEKEFLDFMKDPEQLIGLLTYEKINKFSLPNMAKSLMGRQTAVYLDECLNKNSRILLADGSLMRISRIVSNKLPVSVMSYNEKTGKLEAKKVVGWFRNSPKHFYKVRTELGGNLEASMEHGFFTERGYVPLRDLKVGDSVYIKGVVLNSIQKQLLLGSLLGDASLSRKKGKGLTRNSRFKFNHSSKQESWVQLKYDILKFLCNTEPKIVVNGGYGEYNSTFTTRSLPCFNEIYDLCIKRGKRTVTREWLDQLTPLSLAVWYMDDGSMGYSTNRQGDKVGVSISLHTHSFSEGENHLIVDYFKEVWDICFGVREDTRGRGFYLMANVAETRKFLELVAPYFSDGILDYKIDGYDAGNLMEQYRDNPISEGLIRDKIVKIEKVQLINDKLDTSYNIEVEDNHNYFAGGVLVSNCHRLKTPTAQLTKNFKAIRNLFTYCIGLTATPLTTKLYDLFHIVDFLNPAVFVSKNRFTYNFVNVRMKELANGRRYPEIQGYKNLPLLNQFLEPIMLTYYPSQNTIYHPHYVELEEIEEYIKASKGVMDNGDTKMHATRMIDLQRVVNNSPEKKRLFREVVDSIKDSGFIVYCHFHETIDILSEMLDEMGIEYRSISGEVTSANRKKIKDWFNKNPKGKALLITSAGSQSLNLQSTNQMVFYDIPFGFGAFTQTKGRVERIFSEHDEFDIHFIMIKDTIDEYKYNLVSSYSTLTQKLFHSETVPKADLETFNSKLLKMLRNSLMWKTRKRREI